MKKIEFKIYLFFLFFYLYSCGNGDSSPTLVNVNIYTPSEETGVKPFEGVEFLRFTVSAPEGKITQKEVPFLGKNEIDITNIPYGEKRQITVEACKEKCSLPNAIKAKGHSIPFSIKKGDEKKELNIYVTPVNSFTPPTSSKDKKVKTLNFKARVGATYTLLDDGTVLIAGGAEIKGLANDWLDEKNFQSIISEAEIYDPNTGEFNPTFSTMKIPRAFHTATKVPGGRVFLIGGVTSINGKIESTASVEYYDPLQKKFIFSMKGEKGEEKPIKSISMPRAYHTATLIKTNLANPKYGFFDAIFIAGGRGAVPGYWEIYGIDIGPVAGGTGAELKTPRWNHSATYIDELGKDKIPAVLLFGGENQNEVVSTLEVFNINANKIDDSFFVQNPPGGRRFLHCATFLKNQGILYFIGGFSDKEKKSPLNTVNVYRPGEAIFKPEEQGVLVLNIARGSHQATEMDNNSILITGGKTSSGLTNIAEVIFQYPTNGNYEVTIEKLDSFMNIARLAHGAIFLPTKTVLITGGLESENPWSLTNTAELYNPMQAP